MLIDTERGVFYTKLRGAAQAPASLVAEIVVGRLADALSLSVPARVLIDVPADLQSDDPHEELTQLLRFSVGLNLGFAYLPDATDFHRADVPRVDPDLASKIAWLDGLVQNPDRTAKNPNLMWCRDRLWLIDHGASLGFHHRWSDVTEESPRTQAWSISHHVPEISSHQAGGHRYGVGRGPGPSGIGVGSRRGAGRVSVREWRRYPPTPRSVCCVPVEAVKGAQTFLVHPVASAG